MEHIKVRTAVVALALISWVAVAALAGAGSSPTSKPYREVDVAYDNTTGGIHLEGTLTVPDGKGPFPAVLLITGTGPQDRDETIGPLKPFGVIADGLARVGVASLRMDDRGAGKSTGNWMQASYQDSAGDIRCGLAYLKGRPEVDGRRIGLLGHRDYMTYDVQPCLRGLKIPVLGLWGSKDGLVPAEENAAGLRSCLAGNNNPDSVVRVLPDMNHVFQKSQTDDTAEFFKIQGCMFPEALSVITDWTTQHGF